MDSVGCEGSRSLELSFLYSLITSVLWICSGSSQFEIKLPKFQHTSCSGLISFTNDIKAIFDEMFLTFIPWSATQKGTIIPVHRQCQVFKNTTASCCPFHAPSIIISSLLSSFLIAANNTLIYGINSSPGTLLLNRSSFKPAKFKLQFLCLVQRIWQIMASVRSIGHLFYRW